MQINYSAVWFTVETVVVTDGRSYGEVIEEWLVANQDRFVIGIEFQYVIRASVHIAHRERTKDDVANECEYPA